MGKFPIFTQEHDAIREIARGAAEEFKKHVEADKNLTTTRYSRRTSSASRTNLIRHPRADGGRRRGAGPGDFVALQEIAKGCL